MNVLIVFVERLQFSTWVKIFLCHAIIFIFLTHKTPYHKVVYKLFKVNNGYQTRPNFCLITQQTFLHFSEDEMATNLPYVGLKEVKGRENLNKTLRMCTAELIGTLFLVLIGCGSCLGEFFFNPLGTHWERIGDAFGTHLGRIGYAIGTHWGHIGDALETHW